MTKEIIVEFSGGIDSLYAAHYLAEKYDRIHLLTFKKGYLQFALNSNKTNVDLLKKIHGQDRIVHKIIDMKDLFKELAVKSFRETKRKYGSETSWCIPCRAGMAVMSVIYALENGISEFTDGVNWEQRPDGTKLLTTGDNYPEFLETIKEFAQEYKVQYFSVIYDITSREERRDILIKLGATIDFNSLDRPSKSLLDLFNPLFYKRVQPMCISGYLVHWRRNLLKVHEDITAENIVNSIKPKLATSGREYIREYFAKKGVEIEELLEKRPDLT